ncbi:MAG: hypothetical protein WC479_03150 [Candidatus Izemoplasmatales bacterium]
MSNQTNDMLADQAIETVDEAMKLNDTIPEEARQQLFNEEYQRLMEAE